MAMETVQTALMRMAPPPVRTALLETPLPRIKPARDIAEGFLTDDSIARSLPRVTPAKGPKTLLPKGYEAVAQCGPATIIAKPGASVFRASFSPDMLDDFADRGCSLIQQGCNVCTVSYSGCSDAERKACTDAACLAQTCERKVVCSSKVCTAEGKAPSCESRLARASCLRSEFSSKAPVTASTRQ